MIEERDRQQVLAALEMKRRLEEAMSLAGRYVEKKKLAEKLSGRAVEHRQKAMSARSAAKKLAETVWRLSERLKLVGSPRQ